ncbi:hypothetical protein [Arthrobacter silvisoli]|uniref:hypothetical protein n=1 Tax=Arthrobacter silvisoli TaxID=2291022 RepID=UPI001B345E7C
MTSPSSSASVPSWLSASDDATPWKPVLLRAAIALAFGALTVFWGAPSVQVLAWALGLYLLATAFAVLRSGTVPLGLAAVVALGGVGALLTQSDAGVTASGALALLVLGVWEAVQGLRRRGRQVLARDWLISGVVGIGTAALLPFFTSLGAHALLGVAGGGAIISGVLWALSGLSLRHDAGGRGGRGHGVPAEDVN